MTIRRDQYVIGDIIQFDPVFVSQHVGRDMPSGVDFIVREIKTVPLRNVFDVGHTQWVVIEHLIETENRCYPWSFPRQMSGAWFIPKRSECL